MSNDPIPPPIPPKHEPPVVDSQAEATPDVPQELVPLDRIPLPPFVLVFGVVTLAAFAIALVRFPHAVSTGIGFERAHQALANRKPAEAATLLEPVVREFPKSKEARMDLVQAYTESEQYNKAKELLLTFEGESVDQEEEQRLNDLLSNLQSKAGYDRAPVSSDDPEAQP